MTTNSKKIVFGKILQVRWEQLRIEDELSKDDLRGLHGLCDGRPLANAESKISSALLTIRAVPMLPT